MSLLLIRSSIHPFVCSSVWTFVSLLICKSVIGSTLQFYSWFAIVISIFYSYVCVYLPIRQFINSRIWQVFDPTISHFDDKLLGKFLTKMPRPTYQVLFLFLFHFPLAMCNPDARRLYDDLLGDETLYNKNVRPVADHRDGKKCFLSWQNW